jgi:hypothetical protein
MSKLPKFTLSYDEKKKDWALTADGAERARSRFPTKKEATKKAHSQRLSVRMAAP